MIYCTRQPYISHNLHATPTHHHPLDAKPTHNIPYTPPHHIAYPTRHPYTSPSVIPLTPALHNPVPKYTCPYTPYIPAQQPYTSAPPTCHLYTSSPSTRHTYTSSYLTSQPKHNTIPYKPSQPFALSTNLQKLNQIQHISKSTTVWLDLSVNRNPSGRFYL